jgi:hypothetical protein
MAIIPLALYINRGVGIKINPCPFTPISAAYGLGWLTFTCAFFDFWFLVLDSIFFIK